MLNPTNRRYVETTGEVQKYMLELMSIATETRQKHSHPYGVIPSAWIREMGLKNFKSKNESSLPAMLLYYALVAENTTVRLRDGLDRHYNIAMPTYDRLQKMGIKRSNIHCGIKLLCDLGLVSVEREGRKNIYHILGDRHNDWAKIPASPTSILTPETFKSLLFKYTDQPVRLRAKHTLNALALYLLILMFRDIKTNRATISYDKIEEYTNIQRSDIRTALTALGTLQLIYQENTFKSVGETYRPDCNRYFVIGLAKFSPLKGLRPHMEDGEG